jgi:hypothetical protein
MVRGRDSFHHGLEYEGIGELAALLDRDTPEPPSKRLGRAK